MKRLACVVVAVMAAGTWLGGEQRAERRYDRIGEFLSASIFSLAQSKDGFLWVGIEGGGVARFDGREFTRWSPQKLTSHVSFGRGIGEELVLIVEPAPGAQGGNTLARIAGEEIEPIAGPDGQPWREVRDAAYDEQHRLWVARQTELFYRDEHAAWVRVPMLPIGSDRIRRLARNRRGGVFVVTSGGITSIDGHGVTTNVVRTPWAADVIDRGDGSTFFVEKRPDGGGIFELRDGRSAEVLFQLANFGSFVLRGRTVWAAFDKGMVALRPGEAPEELGPAQGVPGGGILVDSEGSFWVGTTAGLVQIAEPEAALWNEREGLPVTSARYLAKTDEGMWVSTWGGLSRLSRVGGRWRLTTEENVDHKWLLMSDERGTLWGKDRDDFLERSRGGFKRHRVPDSGVVLSMARGSDGTLWVGTDRGLFKTRSSSVPPVTVSLPPDIESIETLFEDSRHRLWITSGNQLFHADAGDVARGRAGAWSRDEISGAREFSRVVEVGAGTLWAASRPGGVWRYDQGKWTRVPGSFAMEMHGVHNLIPSRSGGVWVLGTGRSVRALDRPGSPTGWEVVEELNAWQGLPNAIISDLVEEADGSLWFATGAGVLRIRPEARQARPSAPPVKQTGFLVNGQLRDLTPDRLQISENSQLELRFAVLSFRSPGLLRYQYRLRAEDAWTPANGQDAVFRFLGLRAGRYSAEVRASLDSVNWSAAPARIDFEVLRPWYFRWWAIAAFGLILSAILATAHRARVAVVLRLERQRAAIARDLHDGIGSGLGSIGILAGLVASDAVDESERRQLTREIADTAAELGTALTDIVWSLRPDTVTLEGLAQRITQRGGRLFRNGPPAFSTDFPSSWPVRDLAVAVRHNLLLIASEALHNAARHARAQHVVLGMAPRDRQWALWIADDGRGLEAGSVSADTSGLGLANMRKRAADIDAEISWTSASPAGTIVTVVFSL